MTDPASADAPTAARKRVRPRIELPDGDTLISRHELAEELQVSPRTLQGMNLPTIHLGGVAHHPREASLKAIASRIRQAKPSRRGPIMTWRLQHTRKRPPTRCGKRARGPRIMRADSKTLILIESAGDRLRECEAEAAAAGKRDA